MVDSAASATQFSSGQMAGLEMIGADANGDSTTSMLELAQEQGKAVGLISDTRLTHATPAAFASHQQHRRQENDIAKDLLAHNVDVMLGGGIRYWIPQAANDKDGQAYADLVTQTGGNVRIKSKRKDELNLLDMAAAQGYDLSFDRESLNASTSDKLLGLYSYSAMLDGTDYLYSRNDPSRVQPSLTEMTGKALSVLDKDDDGFFLMVESGMIDWSAHDNDAGGLLHEMMKFNESIEYVMDWMEGRDDTLLIVTADHETGGFGFAYSRANLPEGTPLDGNIFNGDNHKPNWNFGNRNVLDKLFEQKLSYQQITNKFDDLDEVHQTPESMMRLVNENTSFPITLADAKRVLETEENVFYVEGHSYLGAKTFPKINDREEFFVFGAEMRKNLIGLVTSKYSNTVWATDNHTSTPVYIFAYGPDDLENKFGRIQHTTEWAQSVIDIMAHSAQ